MKKTVSLMLTAMLAVQFLMAQVPAGIKFLNYEKNKSAKEAFQKAYDANPKDAQAIYWLGQSMLTNENGEVSKEQIASAKALYQKALGEVGSDPWLLVGMGHVEILEKGDMNSVKQKFEQAITATTETKGKNKGKPSADILNAIGRANAFVPLGSGDHAYAIDKLKQAAAIDPTNPDIMVNMGINYLKMGGENGGEAVKAYQDATNRDPKNARAFYRIGRIYLSQNNKDLFEQNFNAAIAADPVFPPVYLAYFNYYSNRDVNVAKEYLDKYVANADKLPENDLYLADYLFRAGKNAESIAKIKELDAAVGVKTLPKLNLLYALNYDRTGDSVQAKKYLSDYFAAAPSDQVNPQDYEFAVKVFSKFPGSENEAIGFINKAITNDTSKVNKLKYMEQAAGLYAKAKMYPQQIEWLQKINALRGGDLSEYDIYTLMVASFNAKNYTQTMDFARKYITTFPAKAQPYSFFKRSALAADPDTTKGIAIAGLMYLDSVYAAVGKEKYKMDILRNQGFIIYTYGNMINAMKKNSDLKPPASADAPKSEILQQFLAICQKGIDLCNDIIATFPDPNDENNKYAVGAKAEFQKNIDFYSKPQPPRRAGGGASGGGANGKG
jgi:Tfp pilus assembly protein PilF